MSALRCARARVRAHVPLSCSHFCCLSSAHDLKIAAQRRCLRHGRSRKSIVLRAVDSRGSGEERTELRKVKEHTRQAAASAKQSCLCEARPLTSASGL